jgi:hypothetical protein
MIGELAILDTKQDTFHILIKLIGYQINCFHILQRMGEGRYHRRGYQYKGLLKARIGGKRA